MTDFAQAGRKEPPPASGEPDEPGPAALPRSWRELHPPRPKPEGVDYGFLSARGEPVASTRENLLHLARTRALPSLAWSPDTAEMVPPWEVPLVFQAVRDDIVARARRELRIIGGVWVLLALGLWLLAPPSMALKLTVLVGAFLALVAVMVQRRAERAERLSAEELARGFDALVEHQAEEAQPIPATRAVALPIAAVGVVQIVAYAASIEAGALRLDAVAAGEWWRLLTAPVLHGGGGAASLALPPDVASVGASGGLMGMFGFLAVMAMRRKRDLPEGFLKGLLINIALIAAVGALAYRFIDNAAHGGGLLAGVLIGVFAIPGDGHVPRWTAGRVLERAGRAATGLVWLSAAVAILLSLAARFG